MYLVFKTTCVDREIPLREDAFFFTRTMLFPPLNKRNTHDEAKGLCITSKRHIGELGARCLSTLNREQDSRQQSPIGRAVKQYRFALPPQVRSTRLYFEGSSPPPREWAIKSVFCAANLPTIMYFLSVISPLSEAQLSAGPHTTHYNTDDFQITPTIYEATYRPNLIMRKGIYLRRFSGQSPCQSPIIVYPS